jgi:DinB superfamily
MKNLTTELQTIITTFSQRITEIPETDFSAKPTPTKWSRKEVLGHLIDSAENNLRRFICGQYETPPPKIKYEQNFWVSVNQYQTTPSKDVIENWRLINLKICRVLQQMPPENYSKTCDFADGKFLTLEWLAIDYVKHLKHHLNQIIPKSFDIVYPS